MLDNTKKLSPNEYSPLALAFLGDGVYEQCARYYVISQGNCPQGKLHKKNTTLVCAAFQSKAYFILEPYLTEDEIAVLHRGRNATSNHTPKHSGAIEYRHATAVETLFGYLKLLNKTDRINQLFDIIIKESTDLLEG